MKTGTKNVVEIQKGIESIEKLKESHKKEMNELVKKKERGFLYILISSSCFSEYFLLFITLSLLQKITLSYRQTPSVLLQTRYQS